MRGSTVTAPRIMSLPRPPARLPARSVLRLPACFPRQLAADRRLSRIPRARCECSPPGSRPARSCAGGRASSGSGQRGARESGRSTGRFAAARAHTGVENGPIMRRIYTQNGFDPAHGGLPSPTRSSRSGQLKEMNSRCIHLLVGPSRMGSSVPRALLSCEVSRNRWRITHRRFALRAPARRLRRVD